MSQIKLFNHILKMIIISYLKQYSCVQIISAKKKILDKYKH